MIGSKFLTERFGTWEAALAAAGLKPPTKKQPYDKIKIVKDERRQQNELHHQRNLAEKEKKRQQDT